MLLDAASGDCKARTILLEFQTSSDFPREKELCNLVQAKHRYNPSFINKDGETGFRTKPLARSLQYLILQICLQTNDFRCGYNKHLRNTQVGAFVRRAMKQSFRVLLCGLVMKLLHTEVT